MKTSFRRFLALGLSGTFGLALSLAGMDAVAAAPKLPQIDPSKTPASAPKAGGSKGYKWIKGRLRGIDTDAQGRILTITIDEFGKGMNSGAGCGAKIADLPHVAQGIGMRIDIRIVEGCIDRYVIHP